MTTQTQTLTSFVLARIAEDEARAVRWSETWRSEGGLIDLTLTPGPARVLAECEAKRRIVERHRGFGLDEEWAPEGYCGECEGTLSSPCATLRFLALPYADHPEFREEWRP